jgi:hypothetical protein
VSLTDVATTDDVATLLLEHESAQVLFGVEGDVRLHRHNSTALALNADLIFKDGGGTPSSLADHLGQLQALVDAQAAVIASQAAVIASMETRLAAAEAPIILNREQSMASS